MDEIGQSMFSFLLLRSMVPILKRRFDAPPAESHFFRGSKTAFLRLQFLISILLSLSSSRSRTEGSSICDVCTEGEGKNQNMSQIKNLRKNSIDFTDVEGVKKSKKILYENPLSVSDAFRPLTTTMLLLLAQIGRQSVSQSVRAPLLLLFTLIAHSERQGPRPNLFMLMISRSVGVEFLDLNSLA